MSKYPRLKAEASVDVEAECLYRYVYGKNDVFYPHCHEFYEIFLTVLGEVTHQINGKVQKLPEGSLVFIRPDDVHAYIYDTPDSSNTAYINLTFTVDTVKELFKYLSKDFPSKKLLDCDMPPMIVLNELEKQHLLSQVSELNVVNWQDKSALKLHMRSILADIFVRYFYLSKPDDDNIMPVWLTEMMSEMRKPENFADGINKMIEISGKSREHIARTLKKYCRVTATEYINDLRINYASNLLLHTNTKILDICFDCGFQSMSNFYRIFKDKYGISPKEFRVSYKI